MSLRCAAYARYSSELQSPLSIQDQLRKCREFADSQKWRLLDEHVYTDQAVSGVGADRPGVTGLLRAASLSPRSFDVVLVDDTSRLSRRLIDAVAFVERLSFAGVRLVAVS